MRRRKDLPRAPLCDGSQRERQVDCGYDLAEAISRDVTRFATPDGVK